MKSPQITTENFNPSRRPPREQQTERAYRQAMHRALLDLLWIMNPADKIHWQGMTYEDLVVYARDWLQTEAEAVGAASARAESAEEPVESPGLALD